MDARKLAEDNLIFMCVAGSHAYGMATETSDKDYRGLFVGNPFNVVTPFFPTDQVMGLKGEKDSVVYEVSKFLKLLTEQNPNILELLWVDERNITFNSYWYKELRDNRQALLSSKCRHTFAGYAFSQLKRIKGHNKWINSPQPKRRPKEADFVSVVYNFTLHAPWNKVPPFEGVIAWNLGNDMYALTVANNSWIDKHEALVIQEGVMEYQTGKPALIVKFNRQLYKEHLENWTHYWEWKNNRNEVRSELEEKFGYDTKHASHLIRLLRMGKEILDEGVVKVMRPDSEDLKAIRAGKYTYEEIVQMAEGLEADMEASYKTTSLPFSVDPKLAAQLLVDIYFDFWRWARV